MVSVVCGNTGQILEITGIQNQSDVLDIQYNTSYNGKHVISVYDLQGNLIHSGTQISETGHMNYKMPASALSGGLYLVRICSDITSVARKFTIQK